MVEDYDYSKATYDSPNPLRRYAHRQRLHLSLDLLGLKGDEKIVDYGCGDGVFLHRLASQFPNLELVGFEPYLTSPFTGNRVQLFDNFGTLLEQFGAHCFNAVTCFEVLEHFNAPKQTSILTDLALCLQPEGRVVISTPIEIGLPALVKNIMRLRPGRPQFDGMSVSNVIKSTLLRPPSDYRQQEGYLTHMGFDYRVLETLLSQFFKIEKRVFSPFPNGSFHLNSQVFWVCRSKF